VAGTVIALLGAESTGKTRLSVELADALSRDGLSVAVVPEYLREFCDRAGRTPSEDEQAGIAAEQTRRIDLAMSRHDVVIADTTALTIAVYSDQVFGDRSLYGSALAAHRRQASLTLLMALDLPWEADGLIRDGPHVREPVDALFRQALDSAGIGYAAVSGQGGQRQTCALAAARHALGLLPVAEAVDEGASLKRWHAWCERCDDADCERASSGWLGRHVVAGPEQD
jgi:nicotinamide riboside kinase